MRGLSKQECEAMNVAVDEAETCRCHGDDYGAPHVYAAVERIVAAREAALTERIAQALIERRDLVPGIALPAAAAFATCIDIAREIGGTQ